MTLKLFDESVVMRTTIAFLWCLKERQFQVVETNVCPTYVIKFILFCDVLE